MKELNTKKGVVLTTYKREEVDEIVNDMLKYKDISSYDSFVDSLRSFNEMHDNCITEEEASELVGTIEGGMYQNYNGAPLDLPRYNISFYHTTALNSLRSAFSVGDPFFDFEEDLFHIKLEK